MFCLFFNGARLCTEENDNKFFQIQKKAFSKIAMMIIYTDKKSQIVCFNGILKRISQDQQPWWLSGLSRQQLKFFAQFSDES